MIKLKNGENYIPKKQETSENKKTIDSDQTSPVVNILSLGFAFISFLLGLLGWILPSSVIGFLLIFIFAILFGIASIILGAMGLKRKLKGLGIAGLILGIIMTIVAIVGLVFILILII